MVNVVKVLVNVQKVIVAVNMVIAVLLLTIAVKDVKVNLVNVIKLVMEKKLN